MTSLTMQEAQARLPDIIRNLHPGDGIVILENNQPVARLIADSTPARQPRKAGSAKGVLTVAREDDEHLRDFAEYMP